MEHSQSRCHCNNQNNFCRLVKRETRSIDSRAHTPRLSLVQIVAMRGVATGGFIHISLSSALLSTISTDRTRVTSLECHEVSRHSFTTRHIRVTTNTCVWQDDGWRRANKMGVRREERERGERENEPRGERERDQSITARSDVGREKAGEHSNENIDRRRMQAQCKWFDGI